MVNYDGYIHRLTSREQEAVAKMHDLAAEHGLYPLMDKHRQVPSETRDHMFLRFLRARKFKVSKAWELMENDLKWREDIALADLAAKEPAEILGVTDMSPITTRMPWWHQGFDREGRPVVWKTFGNCDVAKVLEHTTLDALLNLHLWQQEYAMRQCAVQGERTGYSVETVVAVFDATDWSMKLATRTAYSFLKGMADLDGVHYPERMGKIVVINSPYMLSFVWKIVSSWLDERTKQKIAIKRGPSEYLPMLREFMDDDQIPEEFGGTGLLRAPRAMIEGRFPESRALLPENAALLTPFPNSVAEYKERLAAAEAAKQQAEAAAKQASANEAKEDEEEKVMLAYEGSDSVSPPGAHSTRPFAGAPFHPTASPPSPTPSRSPSHTADLNGSLSPVSSFGPGGLTLRAPSISLARAGSASSVHRGSCLQSPTMRDSTFLRLTDEEKVVLARRVEASVQAAARDAAALLRLRGDAAYSSEDDIESGSDWGISDAEYDERACGRESGDDDEEEDGSKDVYLGNVPTAPHLAAPAHTTSAATKTVVSSALLASTVLSAVAAAAVPPTSPALVRLAAPVAVLLSLVALVLFASGRVHVSVGAVTPSAHAAVQAAKAAKAARKLLRREKRRRSLKTPVPHRDSRAGLGAAGSLGKSVDGAALRHYLRRLDQME